MSYAFGPIRGNGDGGFLTVGRGEQSTGRGARTQYVDGVGTLPTEGTQLVVSSAAGHRGHAHHRLRRQGATAGPWTNCVSMTSAAFDGTSVRCVNGTVTP